MNKVVIDYFVKKILQSESRVFYFPQVYGSKTRYFFEILTIIGKKSVHTKVKAMLSNDRIIYSYF
ncbi:MAG: hypothetical protein WC379_11730 [Methanoregula sp.]